MAQHSASKPIAVPCLCSKCGACIQYCPQNAMKMGLLTPKIDKNLCTGCAGCIALCKRNALIPNFLESFSKSFLERLMEYAYAAQLGKDIIYLTLAINITRGCDCEGRKMKPFVANLGVLASTDPLSIDQACMDLLDERKGKPVFKRGTARPCPTLNQSASDPENTRLFSFKNNRIHGLKPRQKCLAIVITLSQGYF